MLRSRHQPPQFLEPVLDEMDLWADDGFTVVSVRKLPEKVDTFGDHTHKVRASVEAPGDKAGVENDEDDHSPKKGVRRQLMAFGLAHEAQQGGLHSQH